MNIGETVFTKMTLKVDYCPNVTQEVRKGKSTGPRSLHQYCSLYQIGKKQLQQNN